MPRQDRLPPMQALLMFESAARLASFTAAARELGSTQPAVSQRVVQLEEALGTALFERGHRGVTLTEDGTRLFDAVRQGLDVIRQATSDIRSRRAQRALTLSTDFGFATYWLMPRLPQFKALMPDVDVKIITSQQMPSASGDGADVAIVFGDMHADWGAPGREAVPGTCHAGMQPHVRGDARHVRSLEAAAVARRAHAAGAVALVECMVRRARTGRAADARRADLQQLRAGGACGSHGSGRRARLVAAHRRTGRYGPARRVGETSLVTDRGYMLLTRREEPPAVRAFQDWLLDECDAIV